LVKNKYGRGVLNAIKTGLEEAKTEFVIVTMADLSDPPEVMNAMLLQAQKKGADLVCASRYMKGGKQHGGPVLKGLFSRIAGLSLHWFTRIPTHDISNSFKMYRKSMLDTITIESNGGFEIGMEIVVKAYINGYKITEVPTTWSDRTDGKSNFKLWKWLPHYLHWYWLCVKSIRIKNKKVTSI
jgi:glycosyltransferase involved in cell wall biosynthesis